MPNRPLFKSRFVAALAKRTLLASSSASLRSSAVRSGARLNINGLVYHRRKALGLTSLLGACALLAAIPPGLVAVAARLHGAPPSGAALGVIVVRPPAVLGDADLHPCPRALGGRDHNIGQDPAQRTLYPTLPTYEFRPRTFTKADHEREFPKDSTSHVRLLLSRGRIVQSR